MALASALNLFDLLPLFSGLRWLSVHLITLGGLTQIIFGVLSVLAARRSRVNQTRTRWDIWLILNLGLLILLVGIPLVNAGVRGGAAFDEHIARGGFCPELA
jgi:hypothetical protein